MTSTKFYLVKYRLRMATRRGQPRKVLLLVGDHCQLPPVCSHDNAEDAICKWCHIMFTPEWESAPRWDLSTAYRQQGDIEFMAFLNSCRKRTPTTEEIWAALSQCYIAEDPAKVMDLFTADITVLCTHNTDVEAWNERALLWHADNHHLEGPLHMVAPHTDSEDVPELKDWVRRQAKAGLSWVAKGARVVFTYNINKAKGCCNSVPAVVTEVHVASRDNGDSQDLPEAVTAITVRLSSGKQVRLTRTIKAYTWYGGRIYYVAMFPLQLAYAMTAHKCQGRTLTGPTFLYCRKVFAPGMLYVMLSRVTSRDKLRIIGTLQPAQFCPVLEAAARVHAERKLHNIA
jgi:ATP-dependent DNA helicase PIF1